MLAFVVPGTGVGIQSSSDYVNLKAMEKRAQVAEANAVTAGNRYAEVEAKLEWTEAELERTRAQLELREAQLKRAEALLKEEEDRKGAETDRGHQEKSDEPRVSVNEAVVNKPIEIVNGI
jgi:hypothetical protein